MKWKPGVRSLPWKMALAVGISMVAMAAAATWSLRLATRFDGDSFLPVLMSLQRLTVFYWGQNRYGNLFPFFAAGSGDVTANFQLQAFLRALGSASMPLVGLIFMGVRKRLFAAYALSVGLMLLPFSDQGNYLVWLDAQPYGSSAFFLLGALLLQGAEQLGKMRWAGVAVLLGLAFFLNSGLVVFAAPLWTATAIMTGKKSDWGFVAALAVAFGCNSALASRYGQEYHVTYNYGSVGFDVANFSRAVASIGALASWWMLGVYFVVIVCGLGAIQWRLRVAEGNDGGDRGDGRFGLARRGVFSKIDARVWRAAFLLGAAAFHLGLFANMEWVKLNGFAFRYFMFALAFVPVVCAGLIVEFLSGQVVFDNASRGRREIAYACAAFGIMVTVAFAKLAPFQGGKVFVEAGQRADVLALAEVARDYGASFVAGDYYTVWPTVFHTIHLRQMSGDPDALQVYGLAAKGEILRAVYEDYLRSARRVVVVGADTGVKGCYELALHNDMADWPGRGSLLKSGLLPSGKSYCVLAFERDGNGETNMPGAITAAQTGATPLPEPGAVMLHMMRLDPAAAHWEGGGIVVEKLTAARVALKGPYGNLPAGKYRVDFEIETTGEPGKNVPLLQLDVEDRFGKRIFARQIVTTEMLLSGDGGSHATVEFQVPVDGPTENLDVSLWTFGEVRFVIKTMKVSPVR